MAQMHLTPLSEVVDEVWGKTGTKERDAMEKQLKEEVNAYYLGEAIRKARKAQNLTQEQLGERIGKSLLGQHHFPTFGGSHIAGNPEQSYRLAGRLQWDTVHLKYPSAGQI